MEKEEKFNKKIVDKKPNYYKYSTFVLLGLIIISLMFFGLVKMNQNTYIKGVEFGQLNAVNIIVNEVNSKGSISINTSDSILTLVDSNLIDLAKEETLLEIVQEIKTNGAVSIYNQEEDLILIEYLAPSNFENDSFNESLSLNNEFYFE